MITLPHTWKSTSPSQTFAWAAEWATHLKGGDVVALHGEVGAGKTHFTQGLAHGLGVPQAKRTVLSPTYALEHEHQGTSLLLIHIDLYRLHSLQDLFDLGLEQLIGQPNAVTVVEWAQRIPECLPKHTYHLHFSIAGPRTRICTLSGLSR